VEIKKYQHFKTARMTKKYLYTLRTGTIIESCVLTQKNKPAILLTIPESKETKEIIWREIKLKQCNNNTFAVFKNRQTYDQYKQDNKRKSYKKPDPNKNNLTLSDLYWWYDEFNKEYFENKLPLTRIIKEKLRNYSGVAIHYYGNPTDEYIIKIDNSGRQDISRYLLLLVHEMTHIYEYHEATKKKNYDPIKIKNGPEHSDFFFKKAAEIGILTSRNGYHIAYSDPLTSFLKQHGIDIHKRQKNPYTKRFKEALTQKTWRCLYCGEKITDVTYRTKL
jgi:hypothetical protein